MPGILTEMIIDKYKHGEISFRRMVQELRNLTEVKESPLYDSLTQIDTRRNIDLPNELAQLLADIALTDQPKSVIDIHSSTGKLLSYFRDAHVVKGYSISPEVASLGKVMYPEIDLNVENPIHKEFHETYDCVISSFPRIGRIFYEGMEQNTPIVYMKKALSLLRENGKLIALISNSFLFAGNAQQLRDQILQNFNLELVMSLESGNVPVELRNMSLVVLKNTRPGTSVLMPHFSNNYSEIRSAYQEKTGFAVAVERLKGSRWDPHFYDPRFNKIETNLGNKEVVRLRELSEILCGPVLRREERLENGKYLVVKPSSIQNGRLNLFQENEYVETVGQSDASTLIQPGDIITPLLGNIGEMYIYRENDPPAIANHNVAIIRSKDNEYIKTYLTTPQGLKLFGLQADRKSRGGGLRNLSVRDLSYIKIPILPLNNLNKISDQSIERASESELRELKTLISSLREKYKYEKSRNRELTSYIENRDEKINQTLLMLTNTISSNFKSVQEQISQVDDKIQRLLDLVSTMDADIKVIKNQGLEQDLVLNQLSEKIDHTVNQMTLETYDQYVEKTKAWIVPYWDMLHDLSKRLLPSADMLVENISRLSNSDPSPYILQYCRALENELKAKIFVSYLRDLKERQVNVREEFAWDLETNEQGQPRSRNRSSFDFSRTVEQLLRKEEESWYFELGRMSTFLTKLTGRTVERSPILQDFKQFILRYFESDFVDGQLYETILNVTREYRNRAAHPNEITMEEAKEGKDVIKGLILRVLKDYKG